MAEQSHSEGAQAGTAPPAQHILIVDDRPENLLVLERVLADCGAELVRADNGEAALKATLHQAFALAILDVQMPGMDGYELAEYLRGAAATRTLPIIFLTAVYSDDHHVFRGYEAGAVDFLTKPYRPEVLQAKVRVFLELDRQRRALERAVETERARRWLEHILLRLSDPVLVLDPRGRVQTANGALLGLVGGTREGLSGRLLSEVLDSADGAALLAGIEAALAAGRASALELANRELSVAGRDGAARVALLSAAPLYDEGEVLAGAVVMLKDISERRAAREALQRSEAKYRRLFDSSRDGIALVAVDGAILDANPAFESLAGEAAATSGLFELLELPAAASAADTAELARQVEAQGELQRPDGIRVPIQARAWPCEEATPGRPALWLSVYDLTETRRREQERMLAEKMNTLGMMIGGVAHELNNPLMGIVNYVEHCQAQTAPEDECHELLGDARRETKRCIDLVQNLLHVVRTGRGQGAEVPIATDLAELTERALRLLDYRVAKLGVQVERDLPGGGLRLRTRPQALQQVLLNLIVNALDALEDSHNRVLRVACWAADGECVRIAVTDTGCGIPPAVRQRIFDPFFTTKAVGRGTGLGLTVSRSLVEELGGSLDCESTPGEGTRFVVELPSLAEGTPATEPGRR